MNQARLNLSKVRCLLADRDAFSRGLVAAILQGFGMGRIQQTGDGAGARELIHTTQPDVCFLEGALPDISTPDMVGWIRRQPPPLRYVPIIVLSGYAQQGLVFQVRDSGANLVVCKPLSPQILFDRLSWIAGTQRPFIETGSFLGPDRRFRDAPPPDRRFKRETDIVI